ncbi:MAG: SusC/RagA family TonB-linked outer membrane protein [Bacteroidetes bacterium]|nr:SusC/RagA family TonB-linked outer membrane protein [Bacteroidota bacterium]
MFKKIMLGLLTFVFMVNVNAQNITVKGKVTSEKKNAPIEGATILQKNTKNGTTTNSDGSFSITVKAGTKIIVTAIGFTTKEVNAQANLTIQLAEEVKDLSEVVVTGVGVARDKRTVGIDLATVSSKDLPKSATASIEQALQGKIAGAQILINSGQPGSGADIVLRTYNSLSGSYPLILLDGIQVYDLYSLDLSNVDRVEVIKGAAGGTLYGAQGGNGVIQIFSKKGTRNAAKPTITFGSKYTSDNIITGAWPLVNQFHHYETNAQGYILDNNGKPVAPDANGLWPQPSSVPITLTTMSNKPFKEPVYDHLSQAYQQAFSSNTSLSISGGTEKMDYAFSGNFFKQQNVVKNSFDRTNLTLSLGLELAKGLTLRTSTQVILQNDDLLSGSRFDMIQSENYFDFTKKYNGVLPITLIKEAGQRNPLSEYENHERYSKTNRTVQSANLNYKLNHFIEFDYKYGIDIWNTEGYNYYKNQTANPQYISNGFFWGSTGKGSVYTDYSRSTYQNSLASLFIKTDFEKDFNIHLPITTVTQVAYDWRRDMRHNFWVQGSELPSFPPASIANTNIRTGSEGAYDFITYGTMINQLIDWGKLAGVGFTYRSDYSSAFGQGSKPFNFPRGNVYLRLSELFKSDILSEFKVRAAYGEAGVQPGAYQRQTTVSSGNFQGTGVYLAIPGTLNNPDLKVQVTTELEIGTDIVVQPKFPGAWFSRFNLTYNYYKRESKDIIDNAPSPLSSGADGQVNNVINLKSNGMEISLDINAYRSKKFTWNFGYRFSNPKTQVVSTYLGQPVIKGAYAIRQGTNLGVFWGQYALTSLTAKDPSGAAYLANPANFAVDSYGNVVDKASGKVVLSNSNDKTFMGDPNPSTIMNFINTFTFNNKLTFSFQFDMFNGNKIYNETNQWLYRDTRSKDFDQPVSWNGQAAGAYTVYYSSLYNSVNPVNWFVQDGSFIRLRDVSLSYIINKFPGSIFKSGTITVSGRNLWTKTNYQGLDPEAVSTGAVGRGYDSFTFPNLKSLQIGFNLTF